MFLIDGCKQAYLKKGRANCVWAQRMTKPSSNWCFEAKLRTTAEVPNALETHYIQFEAFNLNLSSSKQQTLQCFSVAPRLYSITLFIQTLFFIQLFISFFIYLFFVVVVFANIEYETEGKYSGTKIKDIL